MPDRHRRGPAVLVLAAALAGACGGEVQGAVPRVNREQVEALLVRKQVETNPRLKVESASCPDGVAARQGETFDCTVTVEGLLVPFAVTVAEVLGDQVRYDLRPRRAVVDVAGVIDFLRSRLEEAWRTARIDCGTAKVRLVDVGGALECTVSDGVGTRYVDAVIEDGDGTVVLRER